MFKSGFLFMLFAVACFFAACKTDPPFDSETQNTIDNDIILKFLDSANITAVKTGSGLYYQILNEGTGTKGIALTDSIYIHYVGRLLKSTAVFDSTQTLNDTAEATRLILGAGIPAWVEGIPKIAPGGRIRLFVPSSLAYQNYSVGTPPDTVITTVTNPNGGTTVTTTVTPGRGYVPENTVLDFDIRLYRTYSPPIKTVN